MPSSDSAGAPAAGTAGAGGGPASGGADSGGATGGAAVFDAQTPPTDPATLEAWLDEGFYQDWACEPEPNTKTEGAAAIHVHGDATRVCTNILLAASALNSEGEFPVGAASVKEVYDERGALSARVVSVKTAPESDGGEGWFWYAAPDTAGHGLAACTGCHAAAAVDADHPGAGDFVYFRVQDEGELPPIDGAAMQAWLEAGHYLEWACESSPGAKTDGAPAIHVHGKNRICTNGRLAAASGEREFPAGSASVKEIYSGASISSYDVYVKVAAKTADGAGWFWYGGSATSSGFGLSACTGCHAAAATDADHPGAGDYVYFKN
jgi:hypothetical protein